jgi:hypothetical protein
MMIKKNDDEIIRDRDKVELAFTTTITEEEEVQKKIN